MKNLILIITLLGLNACGDSSQWFSSGPCYYPDSSKEILAPGWVCGQSRSGAWITAVGYAPATAAGAAFTKNMALADARVKLAQRLKTQCPAGQVREVLLLQSTPLNNQRSPAGGQYIQVGIDHSKLRINCK